MPLDQRPLGDSLATDTSGQAKAVAVGRARGAAVTGNPGHGGRGRMRVNILCVLVAFPPLFFLATE